jgi:hypothetical protein
MKSPKEDAVAFSSLIASIYDAALEPERLSAAVLKITDAIGGDSAVLASLDKVNGGGAVAAGARIDPVSAADFQSHYAEKDIFRPFVLRTDVVLSLKGGGTITLEGIGDGDIDDWEDLVEDRGYNIDFA